MSTKTTATLALPKAVAPVMLRRQCSTCGARAAGPGECTDCARKKRTVRRFAVGASHDPLEREADRVADQVLDAPARVGASPAPLSIRRDTGGASAGGVEAPASVDRALAAAGRPLDTGVRRDMEQRFGHDFSQVRVHDGAVAAQSARDIGANAYTAGRDIVFGANRYAPATRTGRRLLAHELTHVVQQSNAASPDIRRDTAGGGSTVFNDVAKTPTRTAAGVVSGEVARTETAPATDTKPAEVVSRGTMKVQFDPSACWISLPFGYRFVSATQSARADICADPKPPQAVPALPAARFNEIKQNVLDEVNVGLSGWFDVRLSGKGCPGGCTGKSLPINVNAHENNAAPDKTITIVNRGGRANAATICAGSSGSTTARHEGGHQVLGMGDEYEEHDESYRATSPEWFRNERVRSDYSVMGPGQHSRFAMFHERHFNAVKVFLESAFPDCKAELIARKRPVMPDFRLVVGGGYAAFNGSPSAYFEAGARAGIPLDRLRSWEFVIGPQLRYLFTQNDRGKQDAFLLGARFGLEYSAGGASHGPTVGGFGEAGAGKFSATARDYGSPQVGGWAPYGEAGASLGYRSSLSDSARFDFRIEGAAGKGFGPSGVNLPEAPYGVDPRNGKWFRVGATLGVSF
jgi:hypothetical protein